MAPQGRISEIIGQQGKRNNGTEYRVPCCGYPAVLLFFFALTLLCSYFSAQAASAANSPNQTLYKVKPIKNRFSALNYPQYTRFLRYATPRRHANAWHASRTRQRARGRNVRRSRAQPQREGRPCQMAENEGNPEGNHGKSCRSN